MTGLIVICGATATGKSRLGLELAKTLGSVILSADSRQVYRDFNIGTAKPNQEERGQIPHYLIDICDPRETLTVADYQEQSQALITQFHQSQQIPLLVGGTGLYIKSIVKGMIIPQVPPRPEFRMNLSTLEKENPGICHVMLRQIDPPAAEKIHPHDQVRIFRALEVYHTIGKTMSELQGENPPSYPILQIGLACENSTILTERIRQRTEQMLQAGWLEEVQYLCQVYGEDLPLMNTLGYQEMKQYLQGKLSLEEAKEGIILHTRQFAKRQRTWFKASDQIEWYDADDPQLLSKIWERVQVFIN